MRIPAGSSTEIEYPSSDGQPMAENQWQPDAMIDAINALGTHFVDRPDVYASGDLWGRARARRRSTIRSWHRRAQGCGQRATPRVTAKVMVTPYVIADHEEGWELTRRLREQLDLHTEIQR